MFDRRVVSQQLRALQVFETIRLFQSGKIFEGEESRAEQSKADENPEESRGILLKDYCPSICFLFSISFVEFAHHSRFQAFAQKYNFLSSRPLGGREETEAEDCEAIMETYLRKVNKDKAEFLSNSWLLGKKYIFYRYVLKY